MTTEKAQANAAIIHKMATEIKDSFAKDLTMHPPLNMLLQLFADTVLKLQTGELPTSTLESAKIYYLTTLISQYSVDDIAAVYLANNTDTNTVAG